MSLQISEIWWNFILWWKNCSLWEFQNGVFSGVETHDVPEIKPEKRIKRFSTVFSVFFEQAPLPPPEITHVILTALSQLPSFSSPITSKKLFWHSMLSVKNKTCNFSIDLLPLWYAIKRPIFTIRQNHHSLYNRKTESLVLWLLENYFHHIKATLTIQVTVLTVHTAYRQQLV